MSVAYATEHIGRTASFAFGPNPGQELKPTLVVNGKIVESQEPEVNEAREKFLSALKRVSRPLTDEDRIRQGQLLSDPKSKEFVSPEVRDRIERERLDLKHRGKG